MSELRTGRPLGRILVTYGVVVGIYLALVLLLATAYPSTRLVDPVKIGPHTWMGSKAYYGKRVECGWPLVFYAKRYEALDTETTRPLQVVATRFSALALGMNLAGVIAAVGLVHLLVWWVEARQFTLRMLLLGILCLCVLLAVGATAQREFLDPMPVYPDQPME